MPKDTRPDALEALVDRPAEEALLGSLLIAPELLAEIAQTLQPADLYHERYAWILQAMLDLQARGVTPDFVTLPAQLADRGQLEQVGGSAELVRLATVTPTAVYASSYAERVTRLAVRRRVVAAAGAIATAAQNLDNDELTLYRETAGMLDAALTTAAADDTLTQAELLDRWSERQLERMAERELKTPRLTLPWVGLRKVRPLRSGMLTIVAATPGTGKTIFAECCAEHWARNGFSVLFYHYEQPADVMADRQMCRWTGYTMERLEDEVELDATCQRAADTIRAWPGSITFMHCDGWPMARIAMHARQMRRRGIGNVVIVDYLQKAPWRDSKTLNTAQIRGQDVETMKSLAEREKVPVMLLSQLTRDGGRATRKTMNHLRDSGEIGEKANTVITLDSEILETARMFGGRIVEAGQLSPDVTVRVDKQTLGWTGDTRLVANRARFLLADIATQPTE